MYEICGLMFNWEKQLMLWKKGVLPRKFQLVSRADTCVCRFQCDCKPFSDDIQGVEVYDNKRGRKESCIRQNILNTLINPFEFKLNF